MIGASSEKKSLSLGSRLMLNVALGESGERKK